MIFMRLLLMAALLAALAWLAGIGASRANPAGRGTAADPARIGAPPPPASPSLFSPEDLNILEGPDREEWQQPDRIMDALRIADGSRVADVGAGGGWFTIRLAHRVGPNGRVYAEDIQPLMIAAIERRVRREGLVNVQPILGTPTDPRLPEDLDAVLLVDTYPQLDNPVSLLRSLRQSLGPSGLLGIVDFTRDGSGGPGPSLEERVAPEVVIGDGRQAGLTFVRLETFLRYQYMVVFSR